MTICKKFNVTSPCLTPRLHLAVVFDEPMQKCRDQAEENRADESRGPRLDGEARSYSGGHLEHDGVDHDQEQTEGHDCQREGQDSQDQPKRGVYQAEDDGCDERGNKSVQHKSGNKIGHDQQGQGIDKPANQQSHEARPLRQGSAFRLKALLQRKRPQRKCGLGKSDGWILQLSWRNPLKMLKRKIPWTIMETTCSAGFSESSKSAVSPA